SAYTNEVMHCGWYTTCGFRSAATPCASVFRSHFLCRPQIFSQLERADRSRPDGEPRLCAICRGSWPNMSGISTNGARIDRWGNERPVRRYRARLIETLKLERSSRFLCSEAFITFISKPHDDVPDLILAPPSPLPLSRAQARRGCRRDALDDRCLRRLRAILGSELPKRATADIQPVGRARPGHRPRGSSAASRKAISTSCGSLCLISTGKRASVHFWGPPSFVDV